ncbi:MAG TPA: hypothetical protein GXX40_02280 [Firmicutes bacterium]|nr:hypothetical protein [Bacillota bacterium]
MSCRSRHLSDIELDELLFGELGEPDRREAERHLSAREDCTEGAASMKRVVELVEKYGEVKAPVTLWSKVRLAVQRARTEDLTVRQLTWNLIGDGSSSSGGAFGPCVGVAIVGDGGEPDDRPEGCVACTTAIDGGAGQCARLLALVLLGILVPADC